MPDHRPQLHAAEKTRDELRHRVISHAKQGHHAPRLRRAYERWKAEASHLTRIVRRERVDAAPTKSLAWARKQVGITENPPGSNENPKNITRWQRALGPWLVGLAWCGVFLVTSVRKAGVKVPEPARWASVALIEDDARAKRNGFRGWTIDPRKAGPGDAVVLFGRGVHVAEVESIDYKRRVVHTCEGNTSFGPGGSQSNGGCVARRTRSFDEVHGFGLIAYPGR